MHTEFEASFSNIDLQETRNLLESKGAKLIDEEHALQRVTFDFPGSKALENGFARVRIEKNHVTMTIKIFQDTQSIHGQKEIELKVDSFQNAIVFLETLGLLQKSVQESKREIWEFGNCQIMLDQWPFLEPFIEIEGDNQEDVQAAVESLDFNWNQAIFDSVDYFYSQKYSVDRDFVNKIPCIKFDMPNPFVK